MVPATRPTICLTECSRSGDPMRPRKYFWATMLVAFWDQLSGNSTPSCLKSPTSASRISHCTHSNGCLPGSVNRRSRLTPDVEGAAALRLSGMGSPPVGALFRPPLGWTTDRFRRSGRNGLPDAPDLGLELVEAGKCAIYRGELDGGDRVEPGQAPQAELAHLLDLDLGPSPPDL